MRRSMRCSRRCAARSARSERRCIGGTSSPGTFPGALIGDLLDLAGTWRPDIMVRDDVNFGACIAAERLGIAHAAVQAVAFRPHLYSAIHELLDDRGCEIGLPADAEGAMPLRHLFLSPLPTSYLSPDVVLLSTTRAVRPSPLTGPVVKRYPTGWPP